MLIDGASRGATGGRTFTLRHPASGAAIGEIPHASAADVDAAIAAARRAFDTGGWRTTLPPSLTICATSLASCAPPKGSPLGSTPATTPP
jgi:acyl-CoA reductase-like NAD-dependent aldehyde dehydrogenase